MSSAPAKCDRALRSWSACQIQEKRKIGAGMSDEFNILYAKAIKLHFYAAYSYRDFVCGPYSQWSSCREFA